MHALQADADGGADQQAGLQRSREERAASSTAARNAFYQYHASASYGTVHGDGSKHHASARDDTDHGYGSKHNGWPRWHHRRQGPGAAEDAARQAHSGRRACRAAWHGKPGVVAYIGKRPPVLPTAPFEDTTAQDLELMVDRPVGTAKAPSPSPPPIASLGYLDMIVPDLEDHFPPAPAIKAMPPVPESPMSSEEAEVVPDTRTKTATSL